MTRPKIRTDLGAPCPYCGAARDCDHSGTLPPLPPAKRPHDRGGWTENLVGRGRGFERNRA